MFAETFIAGSADELTATIESFMNKLSISVTLMNLFTNFNSLLPLRSINVLLDNGKVLSVNISAGMLFLKVLFDSVLFVAEPLIKIPDNVLLEIILLKIVVSFTRLRIMDVKLAVMLLNETMLPDAGGLEMFRPPPLVTLMLLDTLFLPALVRNNIP